MAILSRAPGLSVISFIFLFLMSAGTAAAAVNLTPYQPSGWPEPLVLSTVAGTTTNASSITNAQTIYVDWAVINNGTTSTTATFYVSLILDGTTIASWYTNPPLDSYYYVGITDYSLGPLSTGTHTLTVRADSTSAISETNESDNQYTRTFNVTGSGTVNLTPYQPSGWSAPIVVSTVSGTTADSSTRTNTQTLYVDWAVANFGTGPTAARFYTDLLVDGVYITSWYSDPPINGNSYVWLSDYAIGPLSTGTHTITIRTDSTGAISETNEADNQYSKTITVTEGGRPNLTAYKPDTWSSPIVVSKFAGTTTESAVTNADTIYVDWAVINSGSIATSTRFYTEIIVDGVVRTSWYSDPPINANGYVYITDYSIGTLSAGTHTIAIRTDSSGVIGESNESDNVYTRNITVGTSTAPNLTAYTPGGWSAPIVVAKTTGTTTDVTPATTDTIYIDWAVANVGSGATSARFYTELLIDGVVRTSWYSDPPINANSFVYVNDYSIGTLSEGSHTISIRTDSSGAVAESNESDNVYTKTINVTSAGTGLYSGPASATSPSGVLTSTTSFARSSNTAFAPHGIADPDPPFEYLPDPEGLPRAVADRSNEVDDEPSDRSSWASRIQAAVTAQTFPAFSHTGWIPPDPHMAVGPNHVVAAVNSAFAIFTKNGTLQKQIDSHPWFGNVVPGLGTSVNSFDPRVIYDHSSNRWIIAFIGKNGSTGSDQSWILLAVSDDSDPNGNWCNYGIRGDRNGSTAVSNWSDYDMLGYDSQAVYVSTNQFTYAGSYAYAKIRLLPKSQLYSTNCSAVTFTDFWDLRQPSSNATRAFTVQPVVTHGTAPGQYFVSDSPFITGTFVTLWTLKSPLSSPTLEAADVPVTTALAPPNADQLGSSSVSGCPAPCLINTGDRRILSAFYRNGSVWAAQTVAGGTNNAYARARYLRIATNPLSKLEDQSFGLDNCWYFFPATATDSSANLVMTFARTCLSEYASLGYTTRAANESSLQPSVMVRNGGSSYAAVDSFGRNRWGDYFGASPDPSDPSKIWLHGQYAANVANTWATHVAAVTFTANCSMSINPASVANGTAGTVYPSVTFTATGATGGVTFSRTGVIPTGMTFSGATLAGTPTSVGSHAFTIAAADSGGCSASRNYTLTVGCQAIAVNPATIPQGRVGSAYGVTFSAAGAIGAVTFTRTGTLPSGMSFSGASLSGTPTQSGSFNITINAQDANGCTGSRAFTLVIQPQSAVLPMVHRAGDFNGDRRADLLWRVMNTGQDMMWLMNGPTITTQAPLETVSTAWTVVGVADFTGDGRADILWRLPSTGQNSLWTMYGTQRTGATYIEGAATNLRVAGVGDFNGDGKADILWRNDSNGVNTVWLMNGPTKLVGANIPAASPNWSLAGIGDFNADGRADLLWRDPANGRNAMWMMNGINLLSAAYIETVAPTWSVIAVADFNGDTRADIFWRVQSSGTNALWTMNGTARLSAVYAPAAAPNFTLVSFGDFNADGRADLLWRDLSSGSNSLWQMNGATLAAGYSLGTLAPAWRVVP